MEKEVVDNIIDKVRFIPSLKTIIVFHDEFYFFTEAPNAKRFHEDLATLLEESVKINVVNVYHHNKELVQKLLTGGKIVFGHYITSNESMGLQPAFLFSYDLTKLSKSDKVKVSKRIHGSEAKIKGKVYTYTGIKDLPGNELISNSTMIVSNDNYEAFIKFLESVKVEFKVKKIWIE